MKRQLDVMPHVMFGGLAHEGALTLARRLAALLPGLDRVFFSDSGSVAVEVAMKMAVQYWLNKGVRGRTKFVAFRGAYHGDTTGAMAVSDPEDGMHRVFGALLPRHYVRDLPSDDDRAAELDRLVADHVRRHRGDHRRTAGAGRRRHAILTMPTRCAGCGASPTVTRCCSSSTRYSPASAAPEPCSRRAAPASCPTSSRLSKALTAGTLPLAATLARKEVFDAFWSDDPSHALMHGPTYMANALACAAANASLDLFEREPRLAQVAAIEKALRAGLAPCGDMPDVRDVRVMGAIGVVELERIDDIDALARAASSPKGVFVRPFGTIVYLTPAFTISPDELATLTDAVVSRVVAARWAER